MEITFVEITVVVEKFISFIIDQFLAHQALILTIVIGLIAGLLAQMILPGKGFGMLASAGLGIAGCWIGNQFIDQYLTMIDNDTLRRIVSGTIGAIVLATIVNLFRFGRMKDKTKWRNNA